MSQLDTHPSNELGKGIIPPADEALLLERGAIYARRAKSGGYHYSKRPFGEVLANFKKPMGEGLPPKSKRIRTKQPV